MINTIIEGDCLEKLKEIDTNSIDSIVTDPPYELGFMGKSWDNTGIANNKEMWAECLRVLKPGGYLLSFGGTRTYHRMACAIEDAGFEVRDMIEWVYGSGFPKSLNIGKSIENKMLTGNASKNGFHKLDGERREGRIGMYDTVEEQGFRKVNPDQLGAFDLEPTTDEAKEWNGWGTALKPAHEPICMARKPLAEKTVAQNVLKYGTGGINIDESRVESSQQDKDMLEAKSSKNPTGVKSAFGGGIASKPDPQGRFPANLLHDNSEEVRECFPETKDGGSRADTRRGQIFVHGGKHESFGGEGNASRYFKSISIEEQDEIQEECTDMEEKLEKLGVPKVFTHDDGCPYSKSDWCEFCPGGEEEYYNIEPSHEPICMARKPLAEKTVAENVLKYGTGGINIDESRVDNEVYELLKETPQEFIIEIKKYI